MASSDEPAEIGADKPLENIIDQAIAASDGERISVHALMHAWGDRSYGPVYIVLGFVSGTPLAAIPAAAAVIGVVIALVAVQRVIGRRHIWLPQWALDRSVTESRARQVRDKMHDTLAFFDRFITERWTWATGPVMRWLANVMVLLLSVAMAPLDAVPFVVGAPAWAIVVFGVALTARDGLLLSLAFLLTGGVGYLVWATLS